MLRSTEEEQQLSPASCPSLVSQPCVPALCPSLGHPSPARGTWNAGNGEDSSCQDRLAAGSLIPTQPPALGVWLQELLHKTFHKPTAEPRGNCSSSLLWKLTETWQGSLGAAQEPWARIWDLGKTEGVVNSSGKLQFPGKAYTASVWECIYPPPAVPAAQRNEGAQLPSSLENQKKWHPAMCSFQVFSKTQCGD